jgi:hypothetical protein
MVLRSYNNATHDNVSYRAEIFTHHASKLLTCPQQIRLSNSLTMASPSESIRPIKSSMRTSFEFVVLDQEICIH